MSNSYREDCNERKAVREGIVEPRPVAGNKKKAKPVIIEYRYPSWLKRLFKNDPTKWRKWKSYADMDAAQRALDTIQRKELGDTLYRIKP